MFKHNGKGFKIRTDTYNWILEIDLPKKRASSKQGSVKTSYHGTLGSLLNALFQHKVKFTKDFDDLRVQLPIIREEILNIMDFDATKGK